MKRPLSIAALLVTLAAGVAGCSHVRPWQREHMARMQAQLQRTDANRAYEDHMWAVREGARGGTRAAGGGCGCN